MGTGIPPLTADYKRYIDAIKAIPVLSQAETLDLARRARNGDDAARQTLIYHNLRLVPKMARRFLPGAKHLSLMDLIQAGNLGLMEAVDRFDPNKGHKFSSYAYWRIRCAIQQALHRDEDEIHVPWEVHKRTGFDNPVAASLDADALSVDHQPVSPPRNPEPSDSVRLEIDWSARFREAGLSPREVEVLKLAYGLADGIERNPVEVARVLRLTPADARSWRKRAVAKLRAGIE